jgi:hypothetical protein
MPVLTADVQPRACTSDTERLEVAEWIEQRRSHFPTAANIERRSKEAAAMACVGPEPSPIAACLLPYHSLAKYEPLVTVICGESTQDLQFPFLLPPNAEATEVHRCLTAGHAFLRADA